MIRFPSTLRLSIDGGEGSGEPEAVDPSATPAPSAPPPPAAAIVIKGTRTEDDVALDLENKKLQTRIAQLEDERRAHLEAQRSHPAPVSVPAAAQKKSWLEGGSFFD